MSWKTPPLPIHLERVPQALIARYKTVREPPEPRRRRLGVSVVEADEAKARNDLYPRKRQILVGLCGLGPFYAHVDRRLAEKKFIQVNEEKP